MQARLPDVNTAFVVYRRHALYALGRRDHELAADMLYVFNGLLPEEYRIRVSTPEYRALTQSHNYAICGRCETKVEYGDARHTKIYLDYWERIVRGKDAKEAWQCPNCQNTNENERTRFVISSRAEPSFLGVVPEPPKRWGHGYSPNTFHGRFASWFSNFLKELEAKAALFRAEWNPADMEEEHAYRA